MGLITAITPEEWAGIWERFAAVTLVGTGAYALILSVILTRIDLRTKTLPNKWTLPLTIVTGLGLTTATVATGQWGVLLNVVLGGVTLFLFYLVMALLLGGIGAGDIKLAFSIGMGLGYFGWWAVLIGTFAAYMLGAIVGVATRLKEIPFGPFMLGGAWATIAVFVAVELLS